MENQSWIKLYRKSKDNELMRDFNAWGLFCWILLSVDKETGKWKVGRYLLSKMLSMPPSTVRNAMNRLGGTYGVIRTSTRTRKYTEISVINWAKYQSNGSDRTTERITGGQREDNVRTLNKNRELENTKKEIYKEKRKSTLEDITVNVLNNVAKEYKVPIGFVKFQFETLKNYCRSTGKTYVDYPSALKNFVIKEMQRVVERQSKKKGGVVDATNIGKMGSDSR